MATKELQVINSVLKNKDINVLFGQAVDDLFTTYQPVWDSIKDYYKQYHAIPDLEVVQETYPFLDDVSVKADSSYYLEGLRNEFITNKMETILLGASKDLTENNAPIILAKIQEKMAALNKYSSSAKDTNIMDFEEAERHYNDLRERAEARGGTPGIPTGISFIDSAYTSGLNGGDLVIVLGWTGRGKSYFTSLIGANAHRYDYRPMIASLEMPAEKVRDRIYTIMGEGVFRNSSLTLGDISTDDFRSFATKKSGGKSFIVVTNDGIAELTPNIMQAKIDQHKPDLLIFDYAQLASDNANSQDMTARMRNMSKEFKRLAVANDIPVILISSATPDSSASSKEPPIIEQVAWSKQLAFDADLALSVHKWDDDDVIEVVCRKNRNGPLFSGYLVWDIDSGIITEKFDL